MSGSPAERYQRVDAIFDALLDLPTDAHAAYIDRACAGDAELRAEVLELLHAHNSTDGFLDGAAAPVAGLVADAAAALAEPPLPARVGAFRVVREIGRGGMGRVLLGERDDGQFAQRVAIKLVQHPAPQLVRRFVEERRILALLEHAGIARLTDGGVTAEGLPYIAMEYVEGEPIDRYCNARDLPVDERVRLFAAVCDAVGYAHQHLVIHRDLKPSNILVTADGQVKLLDFGIAKLLDADGAGADETHAELRAMTPEFAAPEQVRGAAVSTATDVYALGVLLYVLLTGTRPYELRGRSPAEVELIVCGFDPPPPSARVDGPLRRRLRGDLDLIVTTALQKDERRRYQTPAALALDLRLFQEGHAIQARRDSARYRLRKFVGRHRAGVAAAAALVLALAGAASRERVLRGRAEVEARKAREVEDFLVGVFDVADPLAPRPTDGGSVTARALLDRGARRVDSTLAGQPAVQAELRSVLGRVYASLGLYDQAAPLLRRALAQRTALAGAGDAGAAEDMDLLGMTLVRQDRYDEAEPLIRRALERRRRLFGDLDSTTAESLDHLATLLEQRSRYADAEALFREAVAVHVARGDTGVALANALSNLAQTLYRQGKSEEAEPLYRRALDVKRRFLGEQHPLTAMQMQSLAGALEARGNLDEAEQLYRRSLAIKRARLGDAHPSVTISLNNFGGFLARERGRTDEAERLVREAIALDRRIFGPQHSYVAEGLINLGYILRMQGDFAASDSVLREALAIYKGQVGEGGQQTAYTLGHLAQTRFMLGHADEAIRMERDAVARLHASLGDAHPLTLSNTATLARMLTETGQPAEAEALLRPALPRFNRAQRGMRGNYLAGQRTLGAALAAQGRTDEALPLLRESLAGTREQFGAGHWRTAEVQLAYGSALLAAGRGAEAAPFLRAARATLEQHRRDQPWLAARAAAAVAQLPRGGR